MQKDDDAKTESPRDEAARKVGGERNDSKPEPEEDDSEEGDEGEEEEGGKAA